MKTTKMTTPKTIEEIRTEADKAGFTPVTFERDNTKYIKMAFCKKCQKDKMLVFTAKEKGGKYHTARACTCGYREFFGYGPDKKAAKKQDKKPIKITNKCVGKQCTNDLPADRKSYCYTCRPKSKATKETVSNVSM